MRIIAVLTVIANGCDYGFDCPATADCDLCRNRICDWCRHPGTPKTKDSWICYPQCLWKHTNF